MGYIFYNPNPANKRVGDCVIRAVSVVTNQDWETTFVQMCAKGYDMSDMPSANYVWGSYLHDRGFKRTLIPDSCPACYSVRDFCTDHPRGKYLLALDGHVVAVVDGDYYDAWDSGDEVPIYYWQREDT